MAEAADDPLGGVLAEARGECGVQVQAKGVKRLQTLHGTGIYTLPKTNIDPDNGPMEDYFPLPTRGFQVPC